MAVHTHVRERSSVCVREKQCVCEREKQCVSQVCVREKQCVCICLYYAAMWTVNTAHTAHTHTLTHTQLAVAFVLKCRG